MPSKCRHNKRFGAMISQAKESLSTTRTAWRAQLPLDDGRQDPTRARVLDLPLELWTETLTYLRHMPSPMTSVDFQILAYPRNYNIPLEYLERTDVLRALSQTCRRLRNVFQPLAWQQLNTCVMRNRAGSWFHTFGPSILRKSIFVQQNPELGTFVRTMIISISLYAAGNVLPELVRALHNLPNLHTLQIFRVTKSKKMGSALRIAFDGHVFPQIKTMGVPVYGHHILKCCPNVIRIFSYGACPNLIGTIAKYCQRLEELYGFYNHSRYGDEKSGKRLVKAAPNLRIIEFSVPAPPGRIKALSGLKKLCTIKLNAFRCYGPSPPQPFDALKAEENVLCVKAASALLKQSRSTDKTKTVVLEYNPWYDGSDDNDRPWSRIFDVGTGSDSWRFTDQYSWMCAKLW
ncbi:hypothetical protein D9619_005234 [Psilocybe cf. subviscida]|uniref:F-box domain-containing protein n=1 Tax=Psilocybe cf. subviscida TaxID=2480587 RepID=A0A8H5BWH7_9AGAR|nr:hypothetical protein D9619_005234 [Psilocybe cf. subviscida]